MFFYYYKCNVCKFIILCFCEKEFPKLSHFFPPTIGKNKRLGLTGRPSSEIGLLATSKLYTLSDKILAFAPQVISKYNIVFTDVTETYYLLNACILSRI